MLYRNLTTGQSYCYVYVFVKVNIFCHTSVCRRIFVMVKIHLQTPSDIIEQFHLSIVIIILHYITSCKQTIILCSHLLLSALYYREARRFDLIAWGSVESENRVFCTLNPFKLYPAFDIQLLSIFPPSNKIKMHANLSYTLALTF